MSHVDTADMANNSVIGAEMSMSDTTTPSNSPIGGATPSSSSIASAVKPSKNVDLLNNSGMGDLKATKPYKREPLHRFVYFNNDNNNNNNNNNNNKIIIIIIGQRIRLFISACE